MRRDNTTVGRIVVNKYDNKNEKPLLTERERSRRESKKRVFLAFFVIAIMVGACIVLSVIFIDKLSESLNSQVVLQKKIIYETSVEILDENRAESISPRIKEYAGQLEFDLSELGLKVSRIVLPIGKMREVDIHIDGYEMYFKCNIDRGTGVTAEDISRMIKYLTDYGLLNNVTYVDVRVERKAYYK